MLASHIKKKGHTTHSKIDLRNNNSSTVDCKREKKDIKLERKEVKQEGNKYLSFYKSICESLKFLISF